MAQPAPHTRFLTLFSPAEVVIADTAYDADPLRQAIAAKGAIAVIPNNPSRALKYPLDKHLYVQRHLVECCFSKLKQFRRVATRFEKTARNYRAGVTLAAIIYMDPISAPHPLAQQFAIFRLNDIGLYELYSEASLGKAYLRMMGIKPWQEVQRGFSSPSRWRDHERLFWRTR